MSVAGPGTRKLVDSPPCKPSSGHENERQWMNETLSFEAPIDPADTIRASQEVKRRARTRRDRLLRLAQIAAWPVPIGAFVVAFVDGGLSLWLVLLLTAYLALSLALVVWNRVEPAIQARRLARRIRETPSLRD